MKKTLKFTAKVTSICPMANTVKELASKTAFTTEEVPVKTFIFINGAMKFLCMDEPDADHAYAVLQTVDGAKISKKEAVELFSGDYEISVLSVANDIISGTVTVYEEEKNEPEKTKKADLSSEIKNLVEEKVAEGVIDKKGAYARVGYLVDNFVDEPLIKRVIGKWRKYKKPSHNPNTLYVDPFLQETVEAGNESQISKGLRDALAGMGTVYEGDKSVGKNVFADTMAWLQCKPIYLFTLTRQMTPSQVYGDKSTDNSASEKLADFSEEQLAKARAAQDKRRQYRELLLHTSDEALAKFAETAGVFVEGLQKWSAVESIVDEMLSKSEKELLVKAAEFEKLTAQGATVNIIFDQSELYDAVSDGGVLVLNELNLADPNFITSICNPLLDNTGFFSFPGRGQVPINPDLTVIGTQNVDYEGCEMQNEAMVSRFNVLQFEQPDDIRGQLRAGANAILHADGFGDVSEDLVDRVQNFYSGCMNAVREGKASTIMLNIRGCIRALVQVTESEGHAKLSQWLEQCVLNACPKEERTLLTTMLMMQEME